MDNTQTDTPKLARHIGLGALIMYGIGDMLGAGIYATIGKVAGQMGNAAWVAYVASLVAALLTGLSYASIGSRYPKAAGEAFVTHRAFGKPFLTYIIGLAVVASGLTSMATQTRAFANYSSGLMGVLEAEGTLLWVALALLFIGVLTFINFWGIRESTWLNIICTVVEAGGLLFVIFIGFKYWGGNINYLEVPVSTPATGVTGETANALSLSFVLQGAILTFYAFIGFEDMLNITEEVKNPRRNFPIALMTALAVAAVVYIAVAITAVSVLPYATLGASNQPLVDVVREAAPWFKPELFSLIALFAITNTALLNYIMGSRIVYGMARQGFVPRVLSAVHPARRTPHLAILLLMVLVLGLIFAGDIGSLAKATSFLLLCVFIIVNAALIFLKNRPGEPQGAFEVPIFVPAGGILVCGAMLWHSFADKTDAIEMGAFSLSRPPVIALALIGGIALLYLIMRPTNITEETIEAADA